MNVKEQQIRRKIKLKEIGLIAKQAREHDKIKIRELSDKTGYSTQLIYAFEKGKSSNMVILFDCYFNMLDSHNQVKLMNYIIKATMK